MKRNVVAMVSLMLVLCTTLFACAAPQPNIQPSNPSTADSSQETTSSDSPEATKELDVLRIAVAPQVVCAPLFLEEKLGFFKEENIKLDLTFFPAMAPAIAALASGDLDISYMGAGVHPLAAKGQVEIFHLNGLSLGDFLIGNKTLGVSTLDDLKGKTIAVPKGSTSDMLITMILKDKGYNLEDFNIVNMDVAGIVAAMVAGKIDACGTWEPYVSEITTQLGKENVAILGGAKDFTEQVAFVSSYGATPTFIEKNEELTVRFIRAYTKSMDYMLTHMDEAIQATIDNTQATKPALQAQVDEMKLFTSEELKQAFSDGTALKWYDSLIAAMNSVGATTETAPATEYVRTDLLLEALK